ncbi:MAG: thiamine phosphate synthase [Rhodospirillaceae bacterium]|nr:thiamine phosphate synthase [Rhodospirillaceae bacterium]
MSDPVRLPDPASRLSRLPHGYALIRRSSTLSQGRRLRTACRDARVLFFWAGTAREALRLHADGLHLKDNAATRGRQARIWRYRRPRALLIAAAHSPRAIRACAVAGVDAVLVSPVFSTNSHPGAPFIGITRFRLWAREASVAVYALGGLSPTTAHRLISTRCVGLAGIDWVLDISTP